MMKNGTPVRLPSSCDRLKTKRRSFWQELRTATFLGNGKRSRQLWLFLLGVSLLYGCESVTLIAGKDGDIYGIDSSVGTLFKIDPPTHQFVVLRRFSDEGFPRVLVAGTNNTYYGVTEAFTDSSEYSTLFWWKDGEYQRLHTLSSTEGASVGSLVVDASHSLLYGLTTNSNAGGGALFSCTQEGQIRVLRRFSSHTWPAVLWEGNDHNLYGLAMITVSEQIKSVLFTYQPQTGFRLLHIFALCNDFSYPLQSPDGNTYFTAWGGWYRKGALLCLTASQQIQLLYRFKRRVEGYAPELIAYRSGHLYGIAKGGVHGKGLLFDYFKGRCRVLHAFLRESEAPAVGGMYKPRSGSPCYLFRDSLTNGVNMGQDGQLFVVSPVGIYVCTLNGQYTLQRRLPPQLSPKSADGFVSYWMGSRLYGFLSKRQSGVLGELNTQTIVWEYTPETKELRTLAHLEVEPAGEGDKTRGG